MRKDITIYANGCVYCSVCADKKLSVKEITEYVNSANFTGIDSKWKLAKENFEGGDKNPHTCEKDGNKKHYLFVC